MSGWTRLHGSDIAVKDVDVHASGGSEGDLRASGGTRGSLSGGCELHVRGGARASVAPSGGSSVEVEDWGSKCSAGGSEPLRYPFRTTPAVTNERGARNAEHPLTRPRVVGGRRESILTRFPAEVVRVVPEHVREPVHRLRRGPQQARMVMVGEDRAVLLHELLQR